MGTVFELNRRGIFNIESARELLPLVYRISAEAEEELQKLVVQVELARQKTDLDRVAAIEAETKNLIDRWEGKIIKLGLEPKGLWLVDFNAGDGYFCWKYPELDIKFWHGYDDGFSGRQPIQDRP